MVSPLYPACLPDADQVSHFTDLEATAKHISRNDLQGRMGPISKSAAATNKGISEWGLEG